MSRGAIAILLLTALVLAGCTGNRLNSRIATETQDASLEILATRKI
jgi:hypothetical protein